MTKVSKKNGGNNANTVLPPVFPTKFNFKGWSDENCENPKKDGEYLCLCKWHNKEQYQYHILQFSKKDKWEVTDSCEHILWTNLPPSPFS